MHGRIWLVGLLFVMAACAIELPARQIEAGGPGDGPGVNDGSAHDRGGDAVRRDGSAPQLCGNGRIDDGESCDTAIAPGQPGACPDSCDDAIACTKDELLQVGSCRALCRLTPIAACASGDGCCPAGCTSTTDDDCSATCGDGELDDKETCDTAIAAGQPGACPTTCEDKNTCTTDLLLNGETCGAQCSFAPITQCKNGDLCCPTGCNNKTDSDCSASCGNGVVEEGEECDITVAAGQPGACPTSCNDNKPCTKDSLLNAGTCDAQCSHALVKQCANGDNCCPSGCNANNDSDCPSSCGNNIIEPGERCDPPSSCPTSCTPATCKNVTLQGLAAQCTAECVTGNKDDGSSCSGGQCYNGSCCTGCWNGSACVGGTSASACGSGGDVCFACTTSVDCRTPTCSNGTCSTPVAGDGASCPGGTCYAGNCCTGCWTGASCAGGTSTALCGNGGESCVSCPDPVNPCKVRTCIFGVCGEKNAISLWSCPGGTCYNGSCCTGCWDGSSCQTGNTSAVCGAQGSSCDACGPSECCVEVVDFDKTYRNCGANTSPYCLP